MRTPIVQVVLASLMVCGGTVFGADFADYENTCSELGFKKKTPAYGECVLELDRRGKDSAKQAERARVEQQERQAAQLRQQQDQERLARGDGSADHQTCYKYGFMPGTSSYGECRQKLDMARRDMAQKQAAYQLELERYQAEKQRYDEQVAEQKRQREAQAWLKASQFFFGMAAGTSPNALENAANSGRALSGLPPLRTAPTAPQLQNFTITMPGGRAMNCTSGLGNNIDCQPSSINMPVMPRGPNY